MIKPIFLFSLPRSGSTLLQNLLMNHPSISSVDEPWILLPLVYIKKQNGVLSEYSHFSSQMAINNLIDNLPNKGDDYNMELRKYVLNIYQRLSSSEALYFLDKTPRYYLIIDEIQELFPESKFIFLLRHPLDVLSSILLTWKKNSFARLFKNNIDIYDGTMRLSAALTRYRDKSFLLSYKDLVKDPEGVMTQLLRYLELKDVKGLLNPKRNQDLSNLIGDPHLGVKYNSISTGSLEKFKDVFNNKFRVWFAKKYIKQIDDVFLIEQGLDKKEIIEELKKIKAPFIGSLGDIYSYIISDFCARYKINLLVSKAHSWLKSKYVS